MHIFGSTYSFLEIKGFCGRECTSSVSVWFLPTPYVCGRWVKDNFMSHINIYGGTVIFFFIAYKSDWFLQKWPTFVHVNGLMREI